MLLALLSSTVWVRGRVLQVEKVCNRDKACADLAFFVMCCIGEGRVTSIAIKWEKSVECRRGEMIDRYYDGPRPNPFKKSKCVITIPTEKPSPLLLLLPSLPLLPLVSPSHCRTLGSTACRSFVLRKLWRSCGQRGCTISRTMRQPSLRWSTALRLSPHFVSKVTLSWSTYTVVRSVRVQWQIMRRVCCAVNWSGTKPILHTQHHADDATQCDATRHDSMQYYNVCHETYPHNSKAKIVKVGGCEKCFRHFPAIIQSMKPMKAERRYSFWRDGTFHKLSSFVLTATATAKTMMSMMR